MRRKRKGDARNVAGYAHELLRRVAGAGLAGRFTLLAVCPRDATWFTTALDRLVEAGYVERVTERVGVWFYRLSDAGKTAARAHTPPRVWAKWRDE